MTEHPNAVLVREMFRAFRENDLAAIEQVIPEHAVWEFPGRRGRSPDDTKDARESSAS